MPHIRRRTLRDGRDVWQVSVRRKGLPHLSSTWETEAQARVWAENLEADIRLGRNVPELAGSRHTLAESVDRYVRTVLPGLSPTTQETERQRLRWWSERIGSKELRAVTPALLLELRERLVADGCAASTANRYMASLSAVLTRTATEWGWAASNPCRSVRGLPEPSGRVRYLSREEVGRLLDACRLSRNRLVRPLVALALATGARRGELLALTWSDVDLSAGTISLTLTKSGRPRVVPVAGQALELLLDLDRVRRIDTDRVFPSADGRSGFLVRRAFGVACRNAGIEDCRWHDLRHTACSHLVMAGVPLATVAAIVGHRTLEMTMRYSHLSLEHLRSAVSTLAEAYETDICDKIATDGKNRPAK